MKTSLKGVIFDVDGTLVDSNDAHAMAFEQAMNRCGYAIRYEKIRPLIGMGADKLIPSLIGRYAYEKDGAKIEELKSGIFTKQYLPLLQPFPRVKDLIETLLRRRTRLAVATSADGEELTALLRVAGIDGLIKLRASAGDRNASKPDPDTLCEALGLLGLEGRYVVMVGDTPYDVEAARRAGIRIVGFRTGGWNEPKLAADEIYDGPEDLLDHLEESLIARAA